MSLGMSILDFTTGLFRDPASLRAFLDDPEHALRDVGLGDATPEQVHDLIPVVAESMPPDHPLPEVVHSADPAGALQALDVETISAHAPGIECTPVADGEDHAVEAIANWDPIAETDKGLGHIADDSLTPPPVEGDATEPADDYHEHGVYLPPDDPTGDHAIAEGFVDTL